MRPFWKRGSNAGTAVKVNKNKNGDWIVIRPSKTNKKKTDDDAEKGAFTYQLVDWNWGSTPSYKSYFIFRELEQQNMGMTNIIQQLKSMGLRVYVVTNGTHDLFWYVRKVAKDCAQFAAMQADDVQANQNGWNDGRCCCLYQDGGGRLYNLLMEEARGMRKSWLTSSFLYSGLQSTAAIFVLSRTFACMGATHFGVQPALLGAFVALVLSDEISFTRLNVAIMSQAVPSVAAFYLMEYLMNDWPKNLLLALLALSGAASLVSTKFQNYLTMAALLWTCIVFSANIGARAWKNLLFKPLPRPGNLLGSLYAYFVTALLGFAMPYLGSKEAEVGGQSALVAIICQAVFVAIVFLISDLDFAQRLLVLGSERCSQDMVNIVVGAWWTASFLASMYFYRRIPIKTFGGSNERLLIENQMSPVGYSVPHIPDYFISHKHKAKPPSCLPEMCVKIVGFLLALVLGGGIATVGLLSKMGISIFTQ